MSFLPGMTGAMSGFVDRSISATVLSASSTTSTIVIPAAAAIGDLAVLFDYAEGSGLPTDVVPTNWTGLVTATVDNFRIRCSRKVLVGGDPGATITGMNGSVGNDKVMLVFRPSSAIATVTPSTWLAEVTLGNPASQAISASGQAVPIIVFGCAAINGGTAAFSTASPAFDAEVAKAQADIIAGYKIYNSGPANHTIDMNDLGDSNGLASGYLIVA